MPTKRPSPPLGLTAEAAQLWRDLVGEYDFSPPDLALLRVACESLGRADAAKAVLDRDGMTTFDRYGSPKAHPLCDVERSARALFARLLAQLRVNGVPAASGRRGRPGVTQNPPKGDPRRRQPEAPKPVLGSRARIRLDGTR